MKKEQREKERAKQWGRMKETTEERTRKLTKDKQRGWNDERKK